MKAGDLNRRVAFRRAVRVPDGAGGYRDSEPETIATVWGSVKPISGNQRVRFREIGAEVTTRIVIRYRADVDATCTAQLKDGREFAIQSAIVPDDQPEALEILAIERET